jgi:hypothetical protein
VLAVLAQILEHALQSLPNMLAVLVAALASVVAVSFFRGEATIFTPIYQVIIFITGTLSPILGLVGGIAISSLATSSGARPQSAREPPSQCGASIVYRAHRKQEWDQRELATLFSLLFFAIAYFIRLSPYVRGLL